MSAIESRTAVRNRAIVGLPQPLPDELLYSAIARSAKYLGQWGSKSLSREIYGHQGILACPDLPGSLGLLEEVSNGVWGITTAQLALRHTLVGYYTHFRSVEQRRQVLIKMQVSSSNLHLSLGICASNVIAPSKFHLCAACTADDMSVYGETYWRRSHHLPGVLVCARHGLPLSVCQFPFRPKGRHEHIAAHPRMLDDVIDYTSPPEYGAEWQLAKASVALLDSPVADQVYDYRPALKLLGYVGRHEGTAGLKADFERFYGEGLLKYFFKPRLDGNRVGWIDEIVRKPRRALHPLKHLTISLFIERHPRRLQESAVPQKEKTWGIYRVEHRRAEARELADRGFSTNAVAAKLGVDWKTAERMLSSLPVSEPRRGVQQDERDQGAWLGLRRENPNASRTELRRLDPSLYARLYRADRQWLMTHGPLRLAANNGRTSARVCWPTRDHKLSETVLAEVASLRSRCPPLRASKNRVLANLELRALVHHYGDKLPRTVATLNAMCEGVPDFHLRRLTAEVSKQRTSGRPLSPSAALRRAGINAARFADGGAALLAAAVSASIFSQDKN